MQTGSWDQNLRCELDPLLMLHYFLTLQLLFSLLSHVRLFWDLMDCSPPVSSVHRISQARILEWVTIFFSRGSSRPSEWTWVSALAGRFFTFEPQGKLYFLTQCSPNDGGPSSASPGNLLGMRILGTYSRFSERKILGMGSSKLSFNSSYRESWSVGKLGTTALTFNYTVY